MGIKTKRLMPPRSFEEICQQFVELGKLAGKQDRAQSIVDQSKESLQALKKEVLGKPVLRVFMEIGCNPLFTVLPNSFMQDYIQLAGGINIAQELDKEVVSKEFVFLQDPDVIFVVGMGIVGEEELANWKKMKNLKATRNNKIFSLDSYICSPTPVTFVETVKKIIELMY
jgi:iron complex transport system substrate-binding protein